MDQPENNGNDFQNTDETIAIEADEAEEPDSDNEYKVNFWLFMGVLAALALNLLAS